jgi:hypothetical protein
MSSSASRLEDILPLTACQEFFLAGESASSIDSIHVYGYRLAGKVDPDIARRVWSEIVAAYPSLRTSLHILSPGRAFQVIHHAAQPEFRFFDLRHMPRGEAEARSPAHRRRIRPSGSIGASHAVAHRAARSARRGKHSEHHIDHLIFDGWSWIGDRDFSGMRGAGRRRVWTCAPGRFDRGVLLWHRTAGRAGAEAGFARDARCALPAAALCGVPPVAGQDLRDRSAFPAPD